MSFDLWVWKGPAYTLRTINHAIARFEAGDAAAFDASADVHAFRAAVIERFPPLEDVPLDQIDPTGFTPWAATPKVSDRMVAMSLSWRVRDEQLDEILRLVDEHRLWLYDPQRALVKKPPAGGARLDWRRWLPGGRR